MCNDSAILITGTGNNSLGEMICKTLRRAYTGTPIIAIDLNNSSLITNLERTLAFNINLNPLTHHAGYKGVANDVQQVIDNARSQFQFHGIGMVVLAAGMYDFGDLTSTSLDVRQAITGVNVCGKIEILHAVMEMNNKFGFRSEEELTLVDIGSLHGLSASGSRAIYVASKAFGLDLCLSLLHGHEINRMIHFAPGPIDTHMLHRNHWVLKEHGSSEFFEYVREKHAEKYSNVFVGCDDQEFAKMVTGFSENNEVLFNIFNRYKERRARQMAGDNPILNPMDVATVIVDTLQHPTSEEEVVCKINAAGGHVQTQMLSIDQVIRFQVASKQRKSDRP
ncbi:SDR family NAD(P)-dependent oxidoreductase [Gimesia fumaroli]|uniref:Short chain dehydrogenase n=1 Tax=Gimesia fumaroli TaxID=2527976 RepID=A0A518IK87_9PLAN|nr:SDR family NAD(P)-dependent oxidoreductase [Gimesia fumaroli]QDV53513.1 short chain dehydrogenase [Gimesia fumaroli]